MIGGVWKHGQARRDTRNLNFHLLRDEGARVQIMNSFAPDLLSVLEEMELFRDSSKAKSALLHIHISPSTELNDEQLREAADIVRKHLGVEDHQAALVIHDKERDGGDGGRHAHLVIGRVGPNGRAMDSGFEKIKVETAIRIAEFEMGEPVQVGRHSRSSANFLRKIGREDVAQRIEVALKNDPEPPKSAASPEKRRKLDRLGVDFKQTRNLVKDLWRVSDGPKAFRSALESNGLKLEPGKRSNIWIIKCGEVEVGSVDRLLKQDRLDIDKKLRSLNERAEPGYERPDEPSGSERGEPEAEYELWQPNGIGETGRHPTAWCRGREKQPGNTPSYLGAAGSDCQIAAAGATRWRGRIEGAERGPLGYPGRYAASAHGEQFDPSEPTINDAKTAKDFRGPQNINGLGIWRGSAKLGTHLEGPHPDKGLRSSVGVLAIQAQMPAFEGKRVRRYLLVQTLQFTKPARLMLAKHLKPRELQSKANYLSVLNNLARTLQNHDRIQKNYDLIRANYDKVSAGYSELVAKRDKTSLASFKGESDLPKRQLSPVQQARFDRMSKLLDTLEGNGGLETIRLKATLNDLGNVVVDGLAEAVNPDLRDGKIANRSADIRDKDRITADQPTSIAVETLKRDANGRVMRLDVHALSARTAALKAKVEGLGSIGTRKDLVRAHLLQLTSMLRNDLELEAKPEQLTKEPTVVNGHQQQAGIDGAIALAQDDTRIIPKSVPMRLNQSLNFGKQLEERKLALVSKLEGIGDTLAGRQQLLKAVADFSLDEPRSSLKQDHQTAPTQPHLPDSLQIGENVERAPLGSLRPELHSSTEIDDLLGVSTEKRNVSVDWDAVEREVKAAQAQDLVSGTGSTFPDALLREQVDDLLDVPQHLRHVPVDWHQVLREVERDLQQSERVGKEPFAAGTVEARVFPNAQLREQVDDLLGVPQHLRHIPIDWARILREVQGDLKRSQEPSVGPSAAGTVEADVLPDAQMLARVDELLGVPKQLRHVPVDWAQVLREVQGDLKRSQEPSVGPSAAGTVEAGGFPDAQMLEQVDELLGVPKHLRHIPVDWAQVVREVQEDLRSSAQRRNAPEDVKRSNGEVSAEHQVPASTSLDTKDDEFDR
ncbi:relaxase/mobilization nuclease domain-containing protein [Pseudovibrio ascidiaceicola]|uniref:relaxase/mobilization nuclease domain-containing protein n=1 Tax=Pseudovibrio ascidiaceicola TaxID=285279 RepID=UPI003D35AF56